MPTSYIPRIHCWWVRVGPRSRTRRGMRNWFAFDRNAIDEILKELTCHHLFGIGVNCSDLLGVTPAENFETHCGEHTAIMQQTFAVMDFYLCWTYATAVHRNYGRPKMPSRSCAAAPTAGTRQWPWRLYCTRVLK